MQQQQKKQTAAAMFFADNIVVSFPQKRRITQSQGAGTTPEQIPTPLRKTVVMKAGAAGLQKRPAGTTVKPAQLINAIILLDCVQVLPTSSGEALSSSASL
jgi:hypothetical protein